MTTTEVSRSVKPADPQYGDFSFVCIPVAKPKKPTSSRSGSETCGCAVGFWKVMVHPVGDVRKASTLDVALRLRSELVGALCIEHRGPPRSRASTRASTRCACAAQEASVDAKAGAPAAAPVSLH